MGPWAKGFHGPLGPPRDPGVPGIPWVPWAPQGVLGGPWAPDVNKREIDCIPQTACTQTRSWPAAPLEKNVPKTINMWTCTFLDWRGLGPFWRPVVLLTEATSQEEGGVG